METPETRVRLSNEPPVHSRARVRVSSADLPKTWPGRFKIVEDYLSSGLSTRMYSEQQGLGQSTLTKWISEYKKRGTPAPSPPLASSPEFVDIGDVLRQKSSPSKSSSFSSVPTFVLELSGGRRLHLSIGDDYSKLQELIKVLEAL